MARPKGPKPLQETIERMDKKPVKSKRSPLKKKQKRSKR